MTATDNRNPMPITQDIERDAQRELVARLRSLPFMGLVLTSFPIPMPNPSLAADHYDFVVMATNWLRAYHKVIEDQARESVRREQIMRKMQDERAMVRVFFGLPTQDYS